MSKSNKILGILLFSCWSFLGCEAEVANVVGVSSSGFILGIEAIHGSSGLPADGSSQATIRVELFTNAGQLVNGQIVRLTTTLGTLTDGANATALTIGGAIQLTTVNGVAFAVLTSEAAEGNAFVVASTENISATVSVPFVNITTAAN
jgi:hypothetical protein